MEFGRFDMSHMLGRSEKLVISGARSHDVTLFVRSSLAAAGLEKSRLELEGGSDGKVNGAEL